MSQLEIDEIQGIIISGYGCLSCSKYLFLRIDSPSNAKKWLQHILSNNCLTTCNWNSGAYGSAEQPKSAINIAFTHKGLQKLELAAESLKTFPQEFIKGMAEPNRSRQLGDVGINAPINWDFGGSRNFEEIHVLLMLRGKQETLQEIDKEQKHLFESVYTVGCVVAEETGYLPQDGREHFGFRDSISQPEIEGSPKKKIQGQDYIKAGEFILGYLNEDGNLPPTPFVSEKYDKEYDKYNNLQYVQNAPNDSKRKDLGRNGSYLVFRKLRQDVIAFRRYFEKFGDECKLMEAKLVGRWQDGTPLVQAPDRPSQTSKDSSPNDFTYMTLDPHGYRCPLGAHIRRANPRDSLGQDPEASLEGVRRRRILRRGALYGTQVHNQSLEEIEKSQEERGLLFICINADIRRQFEFIQQTWLNNPDFNGLNGETDPIIGTRESCKENSSLEDVARPITIQRQPIRKRLSLPDFVSVKGGGYFFLPSIAALRFLANMPH